MSNLSIRVENLSKRYQIGVQRLPYHTLREVLVEASLAPFRRLRSLMKGEDNRGNSNNFFWALDDVSFEVHEGEAVGIIGRNGAGKSTLLKILSRITKPTTGRAHLYGRVSSMLEVGTGFHPELTGRENIYLNGAILGMRRAEIERKFDEIVAFAETKKFLDTPVKFYSSGMFVRLAFAVAAHLEPEILVVDEVLAVGDAAFQKKCLGKMGDVARGGRTVLFVSHNMSAINRLCSRAILLNAGRVIEDGTALDVTGRYLAGSAEETGTRIWDLDRAPGTEDLRLVSIALYGKDGRPVSVVYVGEQLTLRIEYRVNKPGLRFRCTLNFFTQGVLAFAAMEPTEEIRPRVGTYYSSITIPAHLLAESEYIVGVSIFTSSGGKMHYVALRDALVFQVYDSMTGPSARGDYAQNFAGVLRPLLEWKNGLV